MQKWEVKRYLEEQTNLAWEYKMNQVKGKQSFAKQNKKKHCGHSKHPLPTTQEKTLYMDITRWSIPKSD